MFVSYIFSVNVIVGLPVSINLPINAVAVAELAVVVGEDSLRPRVVTVAVPSPVTAVLNLVIASKGSCILTFGFGALHAAQVVVPEPSVCKKYPLVPPVVGRVIVQVPAAAALVRVRTHDVVPVNLTAPVPVEAAPRVSIPVLSTRNTVVVLFCPLIRLPVAEAVADWDNKSTSVVSVDVPAVCVTTFVNFKTEPDVAKVPPAPFCT